MQQVNRDVGFHAQLFSILMPRVCDSTWKSMLEFCSELRHSTCCIIRGDCNPVFNAHILQFFRNHNKCFWPKIWTVKSCYLGNNGVSLYQDSCLIAYHNLHFRLCEMHTTSMTAIQIATCIGSKIRYCKNTLQFIGIGIYVTTPPVLWNRAYNELIRLIASYGDEECLSLRSSWNLCVYYLDRISIYPRLIIFRIYLIFLYLFPQESLLKLLPRDSLISLLH